MAGEQEVGAIFPVAGLDVTCEFDRQPPDTTPGAANVRSFDSLQFRNRGGSRFGLSRYVNETVNGVAQIQHLALLVDPQDPALNAPVDQGTVLDPSTNNLSQRNFGRLVRAGGSGLQPNRNDPRRGNVEIVQFKEYNFGNVSGPSSFTLDAQPGLNNDIVVFVLTQDLFGTGMVDVTNVRNANLNTYRQVGDSGYVSNFVGVHSTGNQLQAFYKAVSSGAPDQTIQIDPGGSCFMTAFAVEVRNAATNGPVSNKAKSSDTTTGLATWAVGPLALNNTTGQMVLAAFSLINAGVTATGGYTKLAGSVIAVVHRDGLSGVGPENPTVNVSGGSSADGFCSIAVALTR